ncbi:unnamed protein product [Linum trigynum]|uniref:Uncharacterized protein n=1 Tax=Linum trigynum TaxID=586398 RepID=A0AAV2GCQ2_9ROSI
MYAAATSESDYMHKISLKILPKKGKSPISLSSSLLPDSVGTGLKPTEPGASPSMHTQVHNQGLSLPIMLLANQPEAQQQFFISKLAEHYNFYRSSIFC